MSKSRRTDLFIACLIALSCVFLAGAKQDKKQKPVDLQAQPVEVTRITSKGKLIIDYLKKIAKFHDNVVVEDKNGTITAKYMEVIFTSDGSSVSKIIATGNVVIKQKERTATCNYAVYIVQTELLRLAGKPKITEKGNTYTADVIKILCRENKVLFEPSAKIVIKNTGLKNDNSKTQIKGK